MGRKPNQLILEYFDRGVKLEDSSNRYVQTCKACGKRFPKGRIESLIAHIEKNCASIRREDRRRILSHAVPSPEQVALQHRHDIDSMDYSCGHNLSVHHSISGVNNGRNLTGLEALAEASRQLEHPSKPGFSPAFQALPIDPYLDGECPTYEALDMNRDSVENGDGNAYSPTYRNYATDQPSITVPRASSESLLHSNQRPRDSSRLSRIAASATDLEARLPLDDGKQRDQQAISQSHTSGSLQPIASVDSISNSGSSHTNNLAEDPTSTKGLQTPPWPLPDRLHIRTKSSRSPGGHNRLPDKPHGRAQKVRGKFTNSRRQEVQEIRKKGACIRCRMLRKTCSGEIPCKTCASVVSARVWKLDCMRTSIYKEVDVFRTGHFRRIASRQLAGVEEQKSQQWVSCFVKMATGGTEPSLMPFIAQLDRRKDYQSDEGHALNMQFPIGRIVCVDETTDQVFSKLLPYMRSTIFHPSYGEPPLLSSQTFGMIVQSEDKLLAQSFNLWSLTQVIISGPLDFDISLHPSDNEPKDQLEKPGQAEESRTPISRSLHFRHTITAQLQAAAEQGACDISKDVMVELEKRLERKERCRGFETFFVGVILLNCIERMCWAIKRASLTEEAQDCTFERSIDSYIEQAAHFAEFLSKLFQMRGILADVLPNPEDGVLQGGPRNTPTVDQWLSEMQFTSVSLEERRRAPFDASDHRCFDFRFASRLLLLIE